MIPDRRAAIADILGYWIDEVGVARWYVADPAIDTEITTRFGALWREARNDPAQAWAATAQGALANLILLDQFPRNMFRGTADAFGSDLAARARAKTAIARGLDRQVPEPARQFFYLPLMHSESLSDQELCVALLVMRMPDTGAENISHAVRHRGVIRRFGRFPSRNAALGRIDSASELAYRAAGGYMS